MLTAPRMQPHREQLLDVTDAFRDCRMEESAHHIGRKEQDASSSDSEVCAVLHIVFVNKLLQRLALHNL